MKRLELTRLGALMLASVLAACGPSPRGNDQRTGPDAPNAPPDLCAGVVCVPSDDCHAAGVCNPANGKCGPGAALPNGTACNDGNACTQTDACQSGQCRGTNPVTCTASDQCHDKGTCDPTTGICSNPPSRDGSKCDDGNACTQRDSCEAGACLGSDPVSCTASDACHVAGSCDPTTGACSNPTAPNGTACNDGDECTQTDSCQAGACVGTNPVTCAATDDCHEAGTCNPANGKCIPGSPLANGTACSDGNACTTGDACQGGSCTGGTPVTCTASDQCHAAGTCDPSTGACSNPTAPDGTACSDGDACTQTDSCQGGTCTGANPVTCTASDQCHGAGTCDPATGTCSNPTVANGATCNDGDACTTGDQCVDGACNGTPGGNQAGPTRTLGFFMVHETALAACLAKGPIALGGLNVSTLESALGVLWASPARFADGTRRSALDRAQLLLERQLLVADCNVALFGATPPAGLTANASTALGGTDCTDMATLEAELDAFNNSNDSALLPTGFDAGPATPTDAMSIAVDPTSPSNQSCTGSTP